MGRAWPAQLVAAAIAEKIRHVRGAGMSFPAPADCRDFGFPSTDECSELATERTSAGSVLLI